MRLLLPRSKIAGKSAKPHLVGQPRLVGHNEEATRVTVATWERLKREPYFHLSSPAHGWQGKTPRMHADYVDVNDFPEVWKTLSATIDIEARAKELSVMKLMRDLDGARQGS